MIRGLYSAASGMFSLERKQEALSNNLANAQTPGFKKDDTVLRAFPKLLIHRMRDFNENGPIQINGLPYNPGKMTPVGELHNGVYAQERVPNFIQGSIVQTSNPLDIAINDQSIPFQEQNGRQVKPAAFFSVELPDGTGYTRNGKWDVDANGSLVTSDGYRILGANNRPIQLPAGVSKEDLKITDGGQLVVYGNDPTRTRVVGQIGIALAENPLALRRLGGNVYQADNPLPIIDEQTAANLGVSLKQGFIEQSNVDLGQTMTEMMVTLKGYEANQKVIGAYDRSLEQLFSVGKING
jgi:flagellar basal-body rod protein FlgF